MKKLKISKGWKQTVIWLLAADLVFLVLWISSAIADVRGFVTEPNPYTAAYFFLTWLFCIAPLHILLYFKNKKKWKTHLITLVTGIVVFLVAYLAIKDHFIAILEHESILPLVLVIILVVIASIWFATLFIFPLWILFKK